MRAIRLTLASLLLAGSLAAQAPAGRSGREVPPIRQTLGLDVAALTESRGRAAFEALVFGRFAAGIGASYTQTATRDLPYYRYPLPVGQSRPITDQTADTTAVPIESPPCIEGRPCPDPYGFTDPKYRAWSFDVSIRYYPAALSLSNPRQRLMLYIGEFVGFHRRRVEFMAPCYFCYVSPQPLPPDTVVQRPMPGENLPSVNRIVQRLEGFEPGLELGARFIPAGPVFVDVGGWFKLVRIEDPLERHQPGDVDARLVVTVGVGW